MDREIYLFSSAGNYYTAPDGKAVKSYHEGALAYRAFVVDCQGIWIKALFTGTQKHYWIKSDTVHAFEEYTERNSTITLGNEKITGGRGGRNNEGVTGRSKQ
ncbi:hypothetical protein [Shimia abyssi]|uniref:Uncharacterized protein n=1 Tax=Shimia abyssi TaxID=1662395 RepID=A0A2P8FB65_9RHOB|nr:hypothetical protein [Shimia abyssi]PSL18949.1 hypothetical protein CLV88_108128 [Shimia abyssi]